MPISQSVADHRPLPRPLVEPPVSGSQIIENRVVENRVVENRVGDIAAHIPFYGFRTQRRLADDSGVSASVISRLVRGQIQPTLPVACKVAAALSQRLGHALDLGEIFALGGRYPTPSVCHLVGCKGCLPSRFYDQSDQLKPQHHKARPGSWSLPH